MKPYNEFLQSKAVLDQPSGFDVDLKLLNQYLMDWQKVIVRWVIARGRAAIFADCGLGKTIMQLDWLRIISEYTKAPVLDIAPLAVAEQTVDEGKKFGIKVNLCNSQKNVVQGINIINYEKMHKFDMKKFSGVCADESSRIKDFSSQTAMAMIDSFSRTPYRLACTATPSPNDWAEIGTHAEFLGAMTRSEMLSTFFINDTKDTGEWRLKGHVKDNYFWKWMSSWAVMISKPSDLGFSDEGYILPEIKYHEHIIESINKPMGSFFNLPVKGLQSRGKVRRDTIDIRCNEAAQLINSTQDSWIVWCGLNDEGINLTKQIDGAVEVAGRHTDDEKAKRMRDFTKGIINRLVSKCKISGHGMNWQHCSHAAFIGLSDSWEAFYQAVRRIWRFGQLNEVHIHIFIEEREGPVLQNIKAKEIKAQQMIAGTIEHTKEFTKQEITKLSRTVIDYNTEMEMEIPQWLKPMKLIENLNFTRKKSLTLNQGCLRPTTEDLLQEIK